MLSNNEVAVKILYSKEYFDFLAESNRLLLKNFFHEIKGVVLESFNSPQPGTVNDLIKVNHKNIKLTMAASAKKDNSSPKTLLLEIKALETPIRMVNQSETLQSIIKKVNKAITSIHKDFNTPPFLIEVNFLLVTQ